MTDDPFNDALAQALATSRLAAQRVTEWRQRNQEQIDAVLRAVREPTERTMAWVRMHRAQIEAFVAGLNQFRARAEEIEAEWQQAGLGYLVSPLGMAEHLVLSLHAAPGDANELLDFLEAALADSTFVARVCDALDGATVLSDVPSHHLQHGLAHLENREPLNAWPPLIIGLEGAFIDVAVEQGLAVRVDNHVYLTDENGDPLPKKSPSVEGVAKLLGHAPEDTDFGQFLIRQVYGGEGNPFRHGTARDGVRDHAVCLAIAVIGWLDTFVAPGARDLLRDAVAEELSRRDEESERRAEESGL